MSVGFNFSINVWNTYPAIQLLTSGSLSLHNNLTLSNTGPYILSSNKFASSTIIIRPVILPTSGYLGCDN